MQKLRIFFYYYFQTYCRGWASFATVHARMHATYCTCFLNTKKNPIPGKMWSVMARLLFRMRTAVRVKDEMSLWNGMWHGLGNDIIMRNVIHDMAQRNEINRKACALLCRAFLSRQVEWVFITAGSNRLCSTSYSIYFWCFRLYFLSLSAHHSNIVKSQNARGNRTLVEREVGLATILGIIINTVDESDHIWD